MQYFTYNGKYYEEGTAIIDANSRALRYGDGIFETIKIVNATLEHAAEHFDRLWQGMQLLQFDVPKHFTTQKLQQEIIELAKKNKHEQYGRVRLSIIKGNGGLYDAVNHTPNYIIQTWALPPHKGLLNENGLVIGFYPDAKKSCDLFSNIKHNNFLPYNMAALFAKNNKWNDALVLNQYNNICDSTIANVFICKDDVVYTPPLTQGCIAGVIRNVVIKKLLANNITVIEKSLQTEDVLQADEVFLTNSINNMQWVKQIEDKIYANTVAQKIYKLVFE